MQVAQAARDICDVVWLVDLSDAEAAETCRRFGPVVDIGGKDVTAVAGELEQYRVDGLATYLEAGMVDLARLAALLGLPFHTPETALALTDKLCQRETLRAAGLSVPRCWPLPARAARTGALAETLAQVKWPAVLKPRSESGSHHTFLVCDAGETRAVLRDLGAEQDGLLLEEYLPDDLAWHDPTYADYVSVESLVAHGKISHLAITGRFPPVEPFRETGFVLPAKIDAERRDAAYELTEQAIRALGVETGGLHTEVKFTADGPRILEVNGRLGGGIPDLLDRAAEFDLLATTLRIALGEEFMLDAPVACSRVGYRFFLQPPPITGTVTAIDGIPEFAATPGVQSVDMHIRPGQHVDWRDGTRTYLLAALGEASDYSEVNAAWKALHQQITVTYAVGGGST